jgi:hypothetical protein
VSVASSTSHDAHFVHSTDVVDIPTAPNVPKVFLQPKEKLTKWKKGPPPLLPKLKLLSPVPPVVVPERVPATHRKPVKPKQRPILGLAYSDDDSANYSEHTHPVPNVTEFARVVLPPPKKKTKTARKST